MSEPTKTPTDLDAIVEKENMKKLKKLTKQDKIKLAAELDGKISGSEYLSTLGYQTEYDSEFTVWLGGQCERRLPAYDSRYDAIIPLIQKQNIEVQNSLGTIMCDRPDFEYKWFWEATPLQLLDALLVATGKASK